MVTALSPVVQQAGPDLVLSSPALRTRQTVAALLLAAPVTFLEQLYAADADELLDAVRELSARDDEPESVLLVGHNPGVHQLVLELTGGEQLPGYPPATLAVLDLDIDDWWQADTGTARLVSLHLPEDPHD
jgi:phosphohistidine phosphatase